MKRQPQSQWREFAFVLHQVQSAIEPKLSLEKVLSEWNSFSKALAENSRKRRPQMANKVNRSKEVRRHS